jgi:hypothetical protein
MQVQQLLEVQRVPATCRNQVTACLLFAAQQCCVLCDSYLLDIVHSLYVHRARQQLVNPHC